MIDRLGLALSVPALSGLSGAALAAEQPALSELMRYCAYSVAVKDPQARPVPMEATPDNGGVTWHNGTYSLTLQKANGSWYCDVVGHDTAEMAQIGEQVMVEVGGQVDLVNTWDDKTTAVLVGSACVEGNKVVMVVNGGVAEDRGVGLLTVTDFGAGGPCKNG